MVVEKSPPASKGSLDPEEHAGSLCWIFSRTSSAEEATLQEESLAWSQQVKLNLPGPPAKKRKVEPLTWEPAELPSFPILVSHKAIQKHSKLLVYLPVQKKEAEKKKEANT